MGVGAVVKGKLVFKFVKLAGRFDKKLVCTIGGREVNWALDPELNWILEPELNYIFGLAWPSYAPNLALLSIKLPPNSRLDPPVKPIFCGPEIPELSIVLGEDNDEAAMNGWFKLGFEKFGCNGEGEK